LKVPLSMAITVTSKDLPKSLPVGVLNANPVTFVKREEAEKEIPPTPEKVNLSFAIAQIEPTKEYTLGVQVMNISDISLPNVTVTLLANVGSESPVALPFVPDLRGPLS